MNPKSYLGASARWLAAGVGVAAAAYGAAESIFRTETRVMTTDPAARAKFRRYWSFPSPGIILIRWVSLRPLKAEAERRARDEGPQPTLRG